MRISISSDHAGYDLKMQAAQYLTKLGHEVLLGGAENSTEPYSYVEAGQKLAIDVTTAQADRGIAICGTGIGISIVVNKYKGIRCGLCNNEYTARMCREHNDANVMAMGARVVGSAVALAMVDEFLKTEFGGERHAVRVNEIRNLEEELYK